MRRLPAPGDPIWWAAAGTLPGVILPTVIASASILESHFPVGQALSTILWIVILGAAAMAAVILLGSPIYALLTWKWRPLLLWIFFGFFLIADVLPGISVANLLKPWGLKLFASRSATVTEAIRAHEHATGMLPQTLVTLVPGYLAEFPVPGMSAYEGYEYETNQGDCSARNRWHLEVRHSDPFDWHYLLYCPEQDYAAAGLAPHGYRIGKWMLIRMSE